MKRDETQQGGLLNGMNKGGKKTIDQTVERRFFPLLHFYAHIHEKKKKRSLVKNNKNPQVYRRMGKNKAGVFVVKGKKTRRKKE